MMIPDEASQRLAGGGGFSELTFSRMQRHKIGFETKKGNEGDESV